MSRIPIRLRLALAFALAMAIALAALGALLYVRLERSLTEQLDDRLALHAAQIQSRTDLGPATDDGVAQLYDLGGRLLVSEPAGESPMLTREDHRRARLDTFTATRDGRRLRVTTVEGAVLAVAVSLEDRDEALSGLLAQLLVIGPIALLLASVGGYLLAAAALRPVEAMRGEAEAVSALEPGARLTLPPAKDEVRRLGETLNRMLGRLEAAIERERRFVADASHELRTPLAMLRAELDLALRRQRTPEELEDALRSASEETERLSRLAEDLLVLARSAGGELPVRRERLDLHELGAVVAGRFQQQAARAGRAIDVLPSKATIVNADRLRLEQALGNLVDNALRHGHGDVLVEVRPREREIELHVRDTGPGFPPDFVAQAFEPFTRADSARTGPGAGLGLAIVDVIARAHGGSAHVANAAGGADAWIALPVE